MKLDEISRKAKANIVLEDNWKQTVEQRLADLYNQVKESKNG